MKLMRLIGLSAIGLLLMDAAAHAAEKAARRFNRPAPRAGSALLHEQAQRIALMLDTTRPVRDAVDSLLGWRYKPGYSAATNHLNAQGLRSLRLYDSVPPAGVLRVAAFGDSFVFGNDVDDSNTWCARLESRSPRMEVLNYGVGAYGSDQALLRYLNEGRLLHPRIVLVAFDPDALRRVVNVYLPFLSPEAWPLTKPRYVLDAYGHLSLVPNPVPSRAAFTQLMQSPREVTTLGKADGWYEPEMYESSLYERSALVRSGAWFWRWLKNEYLDPARVVRAGVFNARSPSFALEVAVLTQFAAAVHSAGAIPVILMLPDRASVEAIRAGRTLRYATLTDSLRRRGLVVWDGGEAFASARDTDSLFVTEFYSSSGNAQLADWLAPRLESLRTPSNDKDQPRTAT